MDTVSCELGVMDATWKKNNIDNRSRKKGRIERLCKIII